jgi:hypothetical protein
VKLLITLILFLLADTTELPDVTRIRNLYKVALNNKSKAEELISCLDSAKLTPFSLGYKGAATMLLAKFSSNPVSKYRYFTKGKTLLEDAIAQDSASSELRYLRFSVQTNCPSFLRYNSNIAGDKLFLLDAVKYISDAELRINILSVLKNSKYVNEIEKQKI